MLENITTLHVLQSSQISKLYHHIPFIGTSGTHSKQNKTKQKQLKGQRRIRKVMSSSQVAPHTSHLRQLLLSEGKWSGRSREPPKADVPNLSHPGPCPGSGSKPNFPRHWQRQSKQWKLGHFAGPLAGGCCPRQQPTSPILPAGPVLQSVLCYVFKLLY